MLYEHGKNNNLQIWTKRFAVNQSGKYDTEAVEKQLIIYFDDVVSLIEREKWLDIFMSKLKGEVEILRLCGDCLGSLVMLGGEGVENFIKTEAASVGSTSGPVSGATGEGIYFSTNQRVKLPDNHDGTSGDAAPVPAPGSPGSGIKVAILDTGGSKLELFKFLQGVPSCIAPVETLGWNVSGNNANFDDDNAQRHGSIVTRLALGQALSVSRKVNILPVKVHDHSGFCDLFSVLCGMAYAVNAGAKIINASFGYYAPFHYGPYYSVPLYAGFIKGVLASNNVLLVAAAGNIPPEAQIKEYQRQGYNVPEGGFGSLDNVHFFPASFATHMWNVFAVTTVDTTGRQVVTTQHYSQNVVDFGVPADNMDGSFNDPRSPGRTVRGSSFATPVMAGVLALQYDAIKDQFGDKRQIITKLAERGVIRTNDIPGDIRYGILKRDVPSHKLPKE